MYDTKSSSIRDQFIGYSDLTEEEFDALWRNCIFSFDANVLLHIYRYDRRIVNQFIDIFERLSSRIWITYQAAFEFYRKKREVEEEASAHINQVIEAIKKASIALKGRFSVLSRLDRFDTKDSFARIDVLIDEITIDLKKCANTQNSDVRAYYTSRVEKAVGDKVGEKPNEKWIKELCDAGAERYADQTPPGFKDAKKPEPDKYGDYAIWKSLMEKSKQDGLPMIFVTDDRKEDWWEERGGKTIGPLPTLIQEFKMETSQIFYMYNFGQFLTYAGRFLNLIVDQETIKDIERVREEDKIADKEKEQETIRNESNVVNLAQVNPSEYQRLALERQKLMELHNKTVANLSYTGYQINHVGQQVNDARD